MVRLLDLVLALALSSHSVLAADGPAKCGPGKKCPEDSPCCSLYGDCGSGAYCLGGCDPKSSFKIGSCVPAPMCKSKTYKWDDLDSVAPNTKYLGDASKADWVSSGKPLSNNGELLLTMAPDSVGTLLANNHYMWYGKTSARLKTSRGKGVVTAFILMSDVKDEIDFEFIGVDLETAQTNYYHQGITDYTNGANASVSSTDTEFHTYEIDWKPDTMTWSIDGKEVRTVKRSDTFNETSNQYSYPQTPSRVHLSLWPAGLPDNGDGTIEWAGGLVDWEHKDVEDYGYYYATIDEVKMECYDPPKGAKGDGSKSYVYTDRKGTEETVKMTDDDTVLGSFEANGKDMSLGESTATGTSKPSPTKNSGAIPGVNNGNPGSDPDDDGDDDDDDDDDSGDDGGDGGNGGGSMGGGGNRGTNGGDSDDSGKDVTDFSQSGGGDDNGDGGNDTNAAAPQSEQALKGSLFAVLVAVMALVAM